jgi:hypothetical protein
MERVATWGTQSTGQNTENTTQFRKLRRLAAQTQPPKKNAVNPGDLKGSIISYHYIYRI